MNCFARKQQNEANIKNAGYNTDKNSAKSNGVLQNKRRETTAFPDITREQWFWDKAVLS